MPSRLFSTLFACVALAALLVTAGCGLFSRITGGEETLTIEVAGDSLMNNGTAAQVVFYQLSNNVNFQRTPIETFWKDDREALTDELVGGGQQVFLYPGQQEQVRLDLSEETRYVGVAANLRAPEPNQWRRSFSLKEVNDQRVTVRIETNRLTLELAEDD